MNGSNEQTYEEYLRSVREQEARDRARFLGDEAADVVFDARDGSRTDLRGGTYTLTIYTEMPHVDFAARIQKLIDTMSGTKKLLDDLSSKVQPVAELLVAHDDEGVHVEVPVHAAILKEVRSAH